ncbi:hypothetical protein BI49514_02119 [Brevibacterium iodinum ATCC 49514]|uniref:Secreted protein n=1 Tax=Brevibacterium iodinum ATCC 49514 TaxID=1255616 RepID=A0A2H1JLI7_9MICO|nr:DUF6049 family protein [Brevibacterium iodinum]SMX88214.1 hypothetical protein BI49514_02119 [Brevibacterium iodinum ATCC 49514]SUW14083.1 Uncharacterised protein [Brevibacterium iodinum]
MKPIPIRRLRFLTALLSTLLLLAGPVFAYPLLDAAPAAASTDANTDADTDAKKDEVTITLDEVTPWIDDKGTLTVRGTVSNTTKKAVEKPSLSLQMSTRKLDSESRLTSWKQGQARHRTVADLEHDGAEARKKAKKEKDSGPDDSSGSTLDTSFDDTIDPGTSAEFTFRVPADDLDLSTSSPVSSWGPRGLAVQLGDETGLRASALGFTTWYPDPEFDQTKISLLAPVTLPGHSEGGLIPSDRLDAAIAEGGSLDTIAKLLEHKELALAIDPRIIASFEAAIAEPPPADAPEETEEAGGENGEETQSPPVGAPENDDADSSGAELEAAEKQRKRLDSWYQDFVDAAQKHTVVALPYGDPDLSALRGTKIDRLSSFAQKQREIVKDVFPDARTDIVWPVAGSATKNGLRALKKSGNSTAIISDGQQPSITGIHDDAHSQTTITDDGESTIDTLISDTKLTDMSAEAIAEDDPAGALSELVAESAVIQSEAPYRTRSLFVPLPRAAASANWEQTVEELSSAPWIAPTGVDKILDSSTEARGLLRTDADAPHIRKRAVESLAETRANQEDFNSVFSDRDSADIRLDRELLTCTSAAWTLGRNANICAGQAREQSENLMDSLHLRKGSSVLLVTGEKTTIPVTIVNDSPAEATLRIRMKPNTPQLRAQETETVKVPAAETMRVDVPVEGLANADVPTTIEMVTADEVVLPKQESLMVRVRADWENIGTAVIGLALAVVFVIGLIKTISRGRPKIPEQQLADAMARAKTDDPEKR